MPLQKNARLVLLATRTAREHRDFRKTQTGQPSYVPDSHAFEGRRARSLALKRSEYGAAQHLAVLRRYPAEYRREGHGHVAGRRRHLGRKAVEYLWKATGMIGVVGEACRRRTALLTWQL
jgi:hypothetical protein